MSEVKVERVSHRRRQALETRRTIAHAARELFTERGYASASVEAIAEKAGVAARTVYVAFGTKKAILGAICEDWLAEAGVVEAVAEGLRQRDLRRRLALVAYASRRQWESERGVCAILAGAAASDKDVARMLDGWRGDRARSFQSVTAGLEKQLRRGIDSKHAGAVIRAMASYEVYSELVAGEGWTPDEYEKWLHGLLTETLVRPE